MTSYGLRKEEQLAEFLESKYDAEVELGPGNSGIDDLDVEFPNGERWIIQQKSAHKKNAPPSWPSNKDIGRLKSVATNRDATPVVALVHGNRVRFCDAYDREERLTPPKETTSR